MQGGAVALLAEAGLSGAIQTTVPARTALAPIDLKVNYLRPLAADGRLATATGRVLHSGRRVAVATAEVSRRRRPAGGGRHRLGDAAPGPCGGAVAAAPVIGQAEPVQLGLGLVQLERRAEPDPDERAAAGGVGGLDEPAVRLGGLADDRQPQARSGLGASVWRAVEAVEHERQVLVVEARAVVADAEHAVGELDLDRPRRPGSTWRRCRAGW